jgi:hypothetical protein
MPVFPAGNLTTNLPQALAIHYDKNFRKNLKPQTPFVACCEPLEQPLHTGNQYRIYQYDPLAADTNAVNEGAPGSSETLTVVNTTFTQGEYGDYLSFSSAAVAFAIDPVVDNGAKELAFQLGESLSSLVRTVADGMHTTDSSVQTQLAATSTSSFTTLNLSSIRNAVESMRGRAILPFNQQEGLFRGVIHPFSLGDVGADNSNNSPIDMLKHSGESGLNMADDLFVGDLTEVVKIPTSGVEFLQSNLITQTSNYKSVTGLTALRTYIFGADGLFRVRLAAPGTEEIGDGNWQNLMCSVYQNVEPTVADPIGLVPAWAKYHVFFTAGQSPDSTQRARTIDAGSAIS